MHRSAALQLWSGTETKHQKHVTSDCCLYLQIVVCIYRMNHKVKQILVLKPAAGNKENKDLIQTFTLLHFD